LTDTNLVFGIGANTGQDTAALLSRALRVAAIEANPKLCADLRARCWLSPSARRQPPPAYRLGVF
jgi:16S rRNA A1518/A1519 N6-dimethyltransferase RsmA/KsgA/DIM1 with predicted DNA glycosylase/AP lyase activity